MSGYIHIFTFRQQVSVQKHQCAHLNLHLYGENGLSRTELVHASESYLLFFTLIVKKVITP